MRRSPMAELEDNLGAELAAIIRKELAPVLQRVAQLEVGMALGDQMRSFEARIRAIELRETRPPPLRVVGDG
jgi:hypothetical protein